MSKREYKIYGKLPGLNEYTKACRSSKYAGSQMKTDTEKMLMLQMTNRKPLKNKVWITFIWHEQTTRRDKDNVAFAKKFILDALQKCRILPGDDNRYVEGFSDYFIYHEGQGVVVRLEEIDDAVEIVTKGV